MTESWRWKAAQFAERKWWQYYLKGKDPQQYKDWKYGYWQKLLQTCAHYFSWQDSFRVLDAGCGPAGIFMALPHNELTAFDPLLQQYQQDLPHFYPLDYPWVRFQQATMEDFRASEPFDAIFCMNAINHVQNIHTSFDALAACAQKGTYLVVTIDAHTHTIFKHLFRLLPGDVLHPQQLDVNEYQNHLLRRGFELLGTELLSHTFFFDHYMLIARKA